MIFGTNYPKIIIDPDGENKEILLQYSKILRDEAEDDFIIHKSIFTGFRSFITDITIGETTVKRKYWIVEILQNLYKYGSSAAVYYNDVKQYEGTAVRFYRHANGIYLKDGAGAEVPMMIESIREENYKTGDLEDYLIYKFKSTKYVDMTQGVI